MSTHTSALHSAVLVKLHFSKALPLLKLASKKLWFHFNFFNCVCKHNNRSSSALTYWREAGGFKTLRGSVPSQLLRTRAGSELQSRQGHLWVVDPTGLHVGC